MPGDDLASLRGNRVKLTRAAALALAAVISAGLGYFARDAVNDLIVVPLAYLLWQLRGLLAGVAQLVQWGVLVGGVALVLAWQLVPRLKRLPQRAAQSRPGGGAVDATAVALLRARRSSYFRWQLAHRLGRTALKFQDLPVGSNEDSAPAPAISAYLDAGVNQSFVDFASRGRILASRVSGPLDVETEDVVRYLESRFLFDGGSHAEDL